MINAKTEIRDLQNKLLPVCAGARSEITEPAANEALLTIQNPNGGLPIKISVNDFDNEFKVVYYKTPRFFPANQEGVAALLKAIADYTSGAVVYLDLISASSKLTPRDRLVHLQELPADDLDQLIRLCLSKNLLSESDLRFELQSGSAIAVNFWEISKNFCYKMQGGKLIKA